MSVIVLPGVERRDIEHDTPSREVLEVAIAAGITDAIVIGRDRAGAPYIAAAISDADRTIGRLMWAVQFLASHEVVQDGPEPKEPA